MRTSVGLFDALFGKRTMLELPMPDGTVKSIQVTEKWVKEMERTGKMKPIKSEGSIIAHTLGRRPAFTDPHELDEFLMNSRSTYSQESWTVGHEITEEEAAQYSDQGEVFVFFHIVEGEWRGQFVSRAKFAQLKAVEDC